MAKESPAQKKTVERVMHEYKHGELKGRDEKRVKNPKQAVAIALHEAGATNTESAKTNKRNLARTKRKEHAGQTAKDRKGSQSSERSKADLYEEAKRRQIAGRSTMSKTELAHALHG